RPDDVFVLRGEPYSLDYYLRRDLNAPVTITRPAEWLAHTGDPARVWLVDANWAVQDEARAALPADAIMTRQILLGVLDAEFYQTAPGDFLTVYDGQIGLGYLGERDLTAAPGDTLALDLWWRALRQPDEDYSVGVYLIAPDGHTQAQQDGGFDERRIPALLLPQDRWTPDARSLSISADTPPGDYILTVAVYDWHNNQRILPDNAREDGAFPLASVRIVAAPGD
ncbi:MAG: hypothetical protein K8I60_08645, partial [Anaerolineae bacterium]|nr:hypothetical protein [Anaerolineae bacterium]